MLDKGVAACGHCNCRLKVAVRPACCDKESCFARTNVMSCLIINYKKKKKRGLFLFFGYIKGYD